MNIKLVLLAMACLSVFSLAALPKIEITTQGNINESSVGQSCANSGGSWGMGMIYDYNYAPVTNFKLTDPNNSRNDVTSSNKKDSIKVRGNSTSGTTKKPYRLKFQDKVSLFGKEAAKSWVLLANFYDGTFALNAMAFEMGNRMGLEFTNSYQLVDLYINGKYKGIYQLTEQIQNNPGRVDVKGKHGGWLAEFDYHDATYNRDNDKDKIECLQWFNTGSARYNLGTFIKSPELEDTSFTKNPKDSTQLRFVKTDIMALLNKMAENGFPNNGYRDLIDLESFAKYVLVELVLDNFDFNSKTQTGYLPGSNYAYKIESCGKIKAGPLWDFDLAAGVVNNTGGGMWGGGGASSFPAHYQTYQDPIIPRHAFYERLWADPVFKAKYKKAWDKYKNDFTAMGNLITSISSSVSGSIQGNGDNIWANNVMNNTGAPLTTTQHNTEVSNLKTWWNNRLNWVGQQLQNIDTNADIAESTPNCNTSSSSATGQVSSSSRASSSSNASSSSSANNGGQVTLSCTGLQAIVAPDGTIAEPTLTCSNGSNATDPNWFGRPSGNSSWTRNPGSSTTSYNISVNANCGSTSGLQATCGTVTVGDPTPIKQLPQIAIDNKILSINNGINLQVKETAHIEIYNLNGKIQKTMNFGSGVYDVKLGDLPKGMYIMQAKFGSEKKIQRLVVK